MRASHTEAVKLTLEELVGGPSAAPTIIFIAVCVLLSAISVFMYLRSLSTESSEGSVEGSLPMPAQRSRNDDSIGLSSTPSGSARPSRMFARRNTVTVSELKRRYWTIDDGNDTMSVLTFVVNMFADLCPPGFLPLAFGLKATGYIPGLLMLVTFYGLCVYTMYAISKSMQLSGCKDFASQWTNAVGKGSAWFPVLAVFLVCFGCNLSYSCFFADIFAGVMPALGLRMSRSLCLLAFTAFPTTPLCLLKNLSALSCSSGFALVAVLFTAGVMVARAADGSYARGGRFFADLKPELAPKVPDDHLYGFGLPSLALLNALAVAFLSHYNGCKYYRELAGKTPTKLVQCTATAMGICALLFATTAVAAFQTFGMNADGVILKNYSERDPMANAARLVVGLSIIASFPLMFSGLREATITLLKLMFPRSAAELDLVWMQDVVSMVLLALITCIALVVTDAGLVVGVVGAVCGSVCIYVVPCTLYAGAIKSFLSAEKFSMEVAFLRCLTCLGVVLGAAGCYSSLAF